MMKFQHFKQHYLGPLIDLILWIVVCIMIVIYMLNKIIICWWIGLTALLILGTLNFAQFIRKYRKMRNGVVQ